MPRRKRFNRKKPYRHRLLLDEGIHIKKLIPRVNSHHDLLHIRDDLRKAGLGDKKVYDLANELNRTLLTFNGDDFKEYIRPEKSGIIDLSSNLSSEQIDKKLLSFLTHHSPKECLGKIFRITGESGI